MSVVVVKNLHCQVAVAGYSKGKNVVSQNKWIRQVAVVGDNKDQNVVLGDNLCQVVVAGDNKGQNVVAGDN